MGPAFAETVAEMPQAAGGVIGTLHSVSRKHLPNYLNEFEFRWNTRKLVPMGLRVSSSMTTLSINSPV